MRRISMYYRRPLIVGLALAGHLLATVASGLWHRHADWGALLRSACECGSHESDFARDFHVPDACAADSAACVAANLASPQARGDVCENRAGGWAPRSSCDDEHGCPLCHYLSQFSVPAGAAAIVAWQHLWSPAVSAAAEIGVAFPIASLHCRAPPTAA